jgi:hypothetical protein
LEIEGDNAAVGGVVYQAFASSKVGNSRMATYPKFPAAWPMAASCRWQPPSVAKRDCLVERVQPDWGGRPSEPLDPPAEVAAGQRDVRFT